MTVNPPYVPPKGLLAVNNPLVQLDPGLFIWTILTFLVLAGLLAKYAWKPLLAALDARQKVIAAAVDDARKTKEELERVRQESVKVLADARKEADGFITRARADAERFREELRQQASDQAATITKNAEKQIQQETARAIAQLRTEAVDLSLEIASKILRRTVTKADHEQLIDEVVKQIEH